MKTTMCEKESVQVFHSSNVGTAEAQRKEFAGKVLVCIFGLSAKIGWFVALIYIFVLKVSKSSWFLQRGSCPSNFIIVVNRYKRFPYRTQDLSSFRRFAPRVWCHNMFGIIREFL